MFIWRKVQKLFSPKLLRPTSIRDLDAAVEAMEKAVKSTPLNHPDRSACLNNLGVILRSRFEQTELMTDLNAAVKANWDAVKSTPYGHSDRAMYLNSLGVV